jgi:hypothetical protein
MLELAWLSVLFSTLFLVLATFLERFSVIFR